MKASILSSITALAALLAQSVSGRSIPNEPRGVIDFEVTRVAPDYNETVGDNAVTDAAANPVFYLARFFPPAGSHITNFVSTMTVPKRTSKPGIGPRYVWPGLENAATNFVFQDVIGDQQPQGTWSLATWFVGQKESKELKPITKVSPGEHIKSTFDAQSANGVNWIEHYKVTGASPASGTHDTVPFEEGALTNALFAIELYKPAKWDFGPVTWTDISITAVTSDTNWCTSPQFSAPSGVTNFKHSITKPKATKHGNSVTCKVAKLVFESP